MTRTTVRPGWPPFRTWQIERAALDPERRRRLIVRWRQIAADLMRRMLAEVLRRIGAALQPAFDALAAAFRGLVETVRPVAAAFAGFAAALEAGQ